jgi:hypothetical protein
MIEAGLLKEVHSGWPLGIETPIREDSRVANGEKIGSFPSGLAGCQD